jgi:hypothetical protein
MSGEFNIDDEKIFDDRYQLVNKFEKDYWDNKADKSELFSGDYNDLATKQYVDALIVNINEKLNDNIKWSSQKQTSVDDATDLESAIVLINNLKAILKAYGLID